MPHNEHKYFILNKPYGYISQFISNDSKARKKKFLGELFPFPEGTMAVGRLDEKSEGLLLLTTNGKFSAKVSSSKIEKEYYAQVDGMITPEAIFALQQGVEIGLNGEKYITRECAVKAIENPQFQEREKKIRDSRHGPTSWVSITLNEGKFRQVRKMTSAVSFPTLRLVRVRIGKLELSELKAGEVKDITHLIETTEI